MTSRPGRDATQKTKKTKKVGKLFSAITSKVTLNDLTRIAINVTNRIKLRK